MGGLFATSVKSESLRTGWVGTDERQTVGVHHLMRPLRRVSLSVKFQYRVNERYVR